MNPFDYLVITIGIMERVWLYLAGFILLTGGLSALWWRRHPGRLPKSPLGLFLPFLGLRTRRFILCSLAACLALSVLPLLIFIPVAMAITLPIIAVTGRIRKDPAARDMSVPGVLFISFLFFLMALAFLVPLQVFALASYFGFGQPAGTALEKLAVGTRAVSRDTFIGWTGIIVASVLFSFDIFWRLRQARQVKNLPTSKCRSVSLGLAEFRGRAFSAAGPGHAAEPIMQFRQDLFTDGVMEHKVRPFILADDSGRVLVDPGHSFIRAGWITDFFNLFIGFHEINLTRRVRDFETSGEVSRTLLEGDPVYVIGNAEMNPDVVNGPDIVVRPASRSGWNTPLMNFVSGNSERGRRDIHNVFYISDSSQEGAFRDILRGLRRTMFVGAVWLIFSVLLLWSASWPVRQEIHPESWRAANWRGPEPGSDDSIDYSRDARLFRFEKYLKGLTPRSREAIPALVEAVGYDNTRFRGPATKALLTMLPDARQEAKDALPHLINNIQDRRGEVILLSIRALGEFGPVADTAVPALGIQLKRTEKTNTYEISPDMIRYEAAVALEKIGPVARDAVPALREALDDPVPSVREAAARALRSISGEPVEEDKTGQ